MLHSWNTRIDIPHEHASHENPNASLLVVVLPVALNSSRLVLVPLARVFHPFQCRLVSDPRRLQQSC